MKVITIKNHIVHYTDTHNIFHIVHVEYNEQLVYPQLSKRLYTSLDSLILDVENLLNMSSTP